MLNDFLMIQSLTFIKHVYRKYLLKILHKMKDNLRYVYYKRQQSLPYIPICNTKLDSI
jgi:hypothetical protein